MALFLWRFSHGAEVTAWRRGHRAGPGQDGGAPGAEGRRRKTGGREKPSGRGRREGELSAGRKDEVASWTQAGYVCTLGSREQKDDGVAGLRRSAWAHAWRRSVTVLCGTAIGRGGVRTEWHAASGISAGPSPPAR
eukprot:361200-Chlamydomonas_euryale.AAC.27